MNTWSAAQAERDLPKFKEGKMKSGSKLLCVGLVALLVLSATGVATAQEEAHPPRWPVVHGRIESKSRSGFTLSTRHGEARVSVDADTRYRVPGVEQATLANLHVGDTVLVLGRGRGGGAGGFLARWVALLPRVPIHAIKGKVTAIEGQALTVTTRGGDRVLLTDENTQFRVPDVEEPTLADVQVDDRVFAVFEAGAGHALLARMVAVLPEGAPGPIHLRGRVTGVAQSLLRVKVREDEVAVTVTEATQIRVPGVENPTLADVRVGDWVLVIGRPAGLCRVEARAIGVLPPVPAHRYAIPGEVTGIEGTTLTVEDPKDTHTVLTDDQTRFRVPGVEEPTIADVGVGDHILAIGRPAEDKTLLARLILVRPPPQPGAEEPGAAESSMPSPL
jgi:hypothetical protein